MPVCTPPAPAPFELPPGPVRKSTVDEYHRMIDAGFFADDECFELLEGWIVPRKTGSPQHAVAIELIQAEILKLLPAGWRLRVRSGVTTTDSEPEPDIAVIRGNPHDYLTRHPGPADIALAVEVADSSLAQDRALKQRLHARAGIPRYWIVNLVDRRVEVYEGATGTGTLTGYSEQRAFGVGEHVPLVIGDQVIGQVSVSDIMP